MAGHDAEEIKRQYVTLKESFKSSVTLKIADEKMDMIQQMNDVLSGLEALDKQFYSKESTWLNHNEITAMRDLMAEQTNTYSAEMESMMNKMEELRKGYYGNIIAVMGIFLAIFALIMGNIQIFQVLGKDSLDKTVMFLFCGETFLVICILSIILGIGYLIDNSSIIKNTGRFLSAIIAMIFAFPIYIYVYHYRNSILNWPLGAVISICAAALIIIIILAFARSK